MIQPMPLEVSAGEEMVILENLPAFKRNGFHFKVDEEAPATKKLKVGFSNATMCCVT
jgi:DNA mismatch repair protein PMS2